MNKLLIICGLLFSQEGATQQEEPEPYSFQKVNYLKEITFFVPNEIDYTKDYMFMDYGKTESLLDINSIEYIEEEQEIDLGFNTELYLPKGFDPYVAYVDLNSIEYIEEVEAVDLGFDTKKYLPVNFDPYAKPINLNTIAYIEDDEDVTLGYDHKKYLPRGFDAHAPNYNINSIAYIEYDEVALESEIQNQLKKMKTCVKKPTNL